MLRYPATVEPNSLDLLRAPNNTRVHPKSAHVPDDMGSEGTAHLRQFTELDQA